MYFEKRTNDVILLVFAAAVAAPTDIITAAGRIPDLGQTNLTTTPVINVIQIAALSTAAASH